jgi:flavin reductase (DIM6/NTAB) family NADH-FMN oxidoreductase RutF
MDVDFRLLSPRDRYKLLIGSVVPRPIALVTTVDLEGRVNAAPFSFFNAVCDDPPAVAVGVNRSAPHRPKDTAENVLATRAFVVNLVDEALAPRMNVCEVEFPHGVSELEAAGLSAAASVQVAPPFILEAPISLECRLVADVSLAPGRLVVIGEVVHMHIRDELYDAQKRYVLAERAGLVARMHGPGAYARTTDLFDMPRLSAEEKRARFGVAAEPPVV